MLCLKLFVDYACENVSRGFYSIQKTPCILIKHMLFFLQCRLANIERNICMPHYCVQSNNFYSIENSKTQHKCIL